ncbi:MAG: hypothetical protein K5838_04895 [Elusimicrobiales bacterium]|nr:hypothetical protein [Elusimicrobiales bacterium]
MSRMEKFDFVSLLREHGAIQSGHFLLPNGFHTQTYIQPSLLLQYPHIANKLAKELCSLFPGEVNVVLAPSAGSIAISQEVARIKGARALYTDRINGVMLLRHDFKMTEGERVLITDDVLNSGRLCSEAMMLAKGCGARVIGIAAIIDRSTENLNFNVPVRSLLSYPLQLFHSSSCPLCAQNIPLSVPGLGKLPDNMMR